ncbi:CPSF A subunit region-domain-containing protein [Lipomyces oligophaga]|uniref:CPSF A subunit region-domain-containing protein n=1 Tax=Lipomyces oligophaga TaxID=45792 RepID=UPI0034CFC24B
MQVYRDLTPPTTVSFSAVGAFLSASSTNLIVIRGTNKLQIFDFASYESSADDSAGLDPHSSSGQTSSAASSSLLQDGTEDNFLADIGLEQSMSVNLSKLVLIAEFDLHGTVTGLVSLRTAATSSLTPSSSNGPGTARSTSAQQDSLLISFESARLSLVIWDSYRRSLRTISLHYYEKASGPFAASLDTDYASCLKFLRADPNNLCACLKFGKSLFAFIPFRRDDDDDYTDDSFLSASTSKKSSAAALPERAQISYPSFVIPANLFDDAILTVIDACFLYEYREPTLAILFHAKQSWTGLLHETKDSVSFVVVALDLAQRTSTSIISVKDLPYDLVSLVPLPAPIGGSLLIGANEIIHIDSSGRAVGIAVNSVTAEATNFFLADKSSLNLRLEGSRATYLQDNFVLLILGSGVPYLLQFALEGRTIESMDLYPVNVDRNPIAIGGAASCLTVIHQKKKLFVGSIYADSALISWRKSKDTQNSLDITVQQDPANIIQSKDYDDEDQDLYGEPVNGNQLSAQQAVLDFDSNASQKFVFSVHDALINYGPLVDMTVGSTEIQGAPRFNSDCTPSLEIVGARAGENKGTAGLSIFRRSITPRVVSQFPFPNCKALFTVKTKSRDTLTGNSDSMTEQVDKYMIISNNDESLIYDISDQFEEVKDTEFESRGASLAVGSILDGTRIVQLCSSEIRVYDSDLNMVQMMPIYQEEEDIKMTEDEDQAPEPEAVGISFLETEILVLLDNGMAFLLHGDEQSLELVEHGKFPSGTLFSAGCLASLPSDYVPVTTVESNRKRKRSGEQVTDSESISSSISVALMVTSTGDLHIYSTQSLTLLATVAGVDMLPQIIVPFSKASHSSSGSGSVRPGAGLSRRKSSAGLLPRVVKPEFREFRIVEMLFTTLGDSIDRKNYLFFRTDEGDVSLYEPFVPHPNEQGVRFVKVPDMRITRNPELDTTENTSRSITKLRFQRLIPLPAQRGGFDAVFLLDDLDGPDNVFDSQDPTAIVSGESFIIVKTSKASPKAIPFAGGPGVIAIHSFHSMTIDHGLIYASNSGMARIGYLNNDYDFTSPWPAKKISFDFDVHAIDYHPIERTYVASTSVYDTFHFGKKEEDNEQAEEDLSESEFPAFIERGSLKLISPKSWIVVDSYEFEPNETALVVRKVNLQVSEKSSFRREYIAVGTGISFGEDLAAKGFVYIFEIIEVVPEPGKPEHNHKIKLIVKEDVRGVVSTLCGVDGYLLSAQGQKVMVRGLREDNSFLPVAFMDMNLYVTEAKSLKNMILMGDSMKSIWFVGFSEDPFKMQLFGKDLRQVEVVAAEFVISHNLIHFVVADADKKIHIVQYDPEDPRSVSGQKLMPKSEFYTGHNIEALTMLPQATIPEIQIAKAAVVEPSSNEEDKPIKMETEIETEVGTETAQRTDEVDPIAMKPDNKTNYLTIGVTQSGSLMSVIPVSEAVYRKLTMILHQMSERTEHIAGLNPTSYRLFMTSNDYNPTTARPVLDGNLLQRFANLGLEQKTEIMDRVGKVGSNNIWNHLLELERSLSYM